MGGSAAISAPWDDIRAYHARPDWRLVPRRAEPLWRWRRRYLLARVLRISELCEEAATIVAWPWVAAILWDELARRDITESLTDWALGRLGRDPSVGPFQVTGTTGRQVAEFLRSRSNALRCPAAISLPEMRRRLMNFDFATRVVIGRCEQILVTWKDAGHDVCAPMGLGPHRLSPIALLGTLYSQGLGSPKPGPRANARGMQIAGFAAQLRDLNCI